MLEKETKKMEEKLDLVKKMMELEKDKRSQLKGSNQGTMWRGATSKKSIHGYSNAVVSHHQAASAQQTPGSQMSNSSKKRITSGVHRPPSGSITKKSAHSELQIVA